MKLIKKEKEKIKEWRYVCVECGKRAYYRCVECGDTFCREHGEYECPNCEPPYTVEISNTRK